MPKRQWLEQTSQAFRLMLATSWLAPELWRARQDESIRQALSAFSDWTEYLHLVDRHRTQGLSWAALKRVESIDIPEHASRELRTRGDRCRMQALIHLQALAGVLKSFNTAGIPVMPLKGPLLSYEIYGDEAIRQSKDLDILVNYHQLSTAQDCLESIGWCLRPEYLSLTPRQAGFNRTYERHVVYMRTQPYCELELHWRSGVESPEIAADQMARALPSLWRGHSYLAMPPADLAVYLCNHGSDHVWTRVKWLGDLARIYSCCRVDWYAAFRLACQTGQGRALLMSLDLLRDAYELPVPNEMDCVFHPLPDALIRTATREMKTPTEIGQRSIFRNLLDRVRTYRYKRLLEPDKSRLENLAVLAVRRADFRVLQLPDRLFWLYVPMRPVLWAWRNLKEFTHDRKRLRARRSSRN
jgi:hypothetical protein